MFMKISIYVSCCTTVFCYGGTLSFEILAPLYITVYRCFSDGYLLCFSVLTLPFLVMLEGNGLGGNGAGGLD